MSSSGYNTPSFPTFTDAQSAFRESLSNRSQSTRANYLSALNRFIEFLVATGVDAQLTRTDSFPCDTIARFYTWLIQHYDNEGTRTSYAAGVSAFFRFLDRRRWLAVDLTGDDLDAALRSIAQSPARHTASDSSVAALDALDGSVSSGAAHPSTVTFVSTPTTPIEEKRNNAIVRLLLVAGVRSGSIAQLDRGDFLDCTVALVRLRERTGGERVITLDADTQYALKTYLEAREDAWAPMFIRHDDGRAAPGRSGEHWRLSRQSIWAVVKSRLRQGSAPVTPRHFRHYKASSILLQPGEVAPDGSRESAIDHLCDLKPTTTLKILASLLDGS